MTGSSSSSSSSNSGNSGSAIGKLAPFHDPRVTLRSAHINGRTYGYIHQARDANTPDRGTIILIHGFPDLAYGWRYQIPFLASLGLDVIAPDCMGYGRTDSPAHALHDFTFKRIADDIAALCAQLNLDKHGVILGGHDWGGAIIYRVALYYPHLIRALFVVCTPFTPPSPVYTPLAQIVASRLPNFGYQLVLASGVVETHTGHNSPLAIRQFLSSLYGARTPKGEYTFSPVHGPDLAKQATIVDPPPAHLISAQELDFYVQEYSRNGLRGPLNWYRTHELNYIDEYQYFFAHSGHKDNREDASKEPQAPKKKPPSVTLQQETLFILANKDSVLLPRMSGKMHSQIPHLTRREVEASHWALWERPNEVNAFVAEWLAAKVFPAAAAPRL